jgi:hypothetical protein
VTLKAQLQADLGQLANRRMQTLKTIDSKSPP